MNELDKDYSYLEETPVKFHGIVGDKDAIVAFCDYNVGITIVDAKSKDKLQCLNGPMSPNEEDRSAIQDGYDNGFEAMIKMIENGFIDANEIDFILTGYRPVYGFGYNPACASGM